MPTKDTVPDSKDQDARTQAQPTADNAIQQSASPDLYASVLRLQNTHGNRFVQRLLRCRLAQAKLTVSNPGDQLEQEADRVAAQVMRMPEPLPSRQASETQESQVQPSVQRMCSDCEEELQRRPSGEEGCNQCSEVSSEVEAHIAALDGGGQALPEAARDFFEPRFGRDFSQVRIHTDARAGETARVLNARAFTLGHHIVFGDGEYQPQTDAGRYLMAHELTHVVQQGAAASGLRQVKRQVDEENMQGGNDLVQRSSERLLQRACDPAGIGTPVGCTPDTTEPVGALALFRSACDEFATAAERQKIKDFADSMTATDTVTVHGFASADGDATFNDNLSCARAIRAKSELEANGIRAAQISIVKHGATPGPAPTRRSVVLELAAGVTRPVVPQLTAVITTAPTPGDCGRMNFVVRWNLSRNSAANGGFVIQHVHETWDVRDCTGTTVPNPDPRTSPLDFFEAWRVLPASTAMTPVNTDTFFWPSAAPWAGGCTDGTVTITATAQYHDDVAALPGHMITPNPATFAGGLQSSITDPALGGNVSRSVPHSLSFSWVCCPCSTSPTVVDEHTP